VGKVTKGQARQMAEELLAIKAVADRYSELEKQLKAAMCELKMQEIAVEGKGRVFIAVSERVTIAPDFARDVLGALANKLIEVKESVSNKLLEALVRTGDITGDQQEQLMAGAKKADVVSLYVRPLS
jgi:Holliday junction resolvasome RuvABC endonuclease subunit